MGHIRPRDIPFRCTRCGALVTRYHNTRFHYHGGKVCGKLERVKPKESTR